MIEFENSEWHHAPSHVFVPDATYCVTAATLHKHRLFNTPQKLDVLRSILFAECHSCGWSLEAWALFSNHYHIVAYAQREADSCEALFKRIHAKSGDWLNEVDDCHGRRVWYNYWETQLTYEKSYCARLHYVHENPVRHGLVPLAENYRWCSMGWFMQRGKTSHVKKILSFKIDKVKMIDDFDPV